MNELLEVSLPPIEGKIWKGQLSLILYNSNRRISKPELPTNEKKWVLGCTLSEGRRVVSIVFEAFYISIASGGVKSYIGMNGAESVFCSAFKIQAFT